MARLAIGALAAAIVMFFWGFLFWGTPFVYDNLMERVADDKAVMQALDDNMATSGVYYVPDLANRGGEGFAELHEKGPLAFVFFRKDGAPEFDPMVMLYGFLHFLVAAFILAWLMNRVMDPSATPGARIIFGGAVGLLAGFFIHIGNVVWWSWPLAFQAFALVYDISAFALAALVIGFFLKPKNQS